MVAVVGVRDGVEGFVVARRRRGESVPEVVAGGIMRNSVGLVGAVFVRWWLEEVVVLVCEEDDGLRRWSEAIMEAVCYPCL